MVYFKATRTLHSGFIFTLRAVVMMAFYADDPKLKACLHGYETLPTSEVPLALITKLPSWKPLIPFFADVAHEPEERVIYAFSCCKWFHLELAHAEDDFCQTKLYVFPVLYSFEGLKDQDILTCPSGWSLYTDVEINHWMFVHDKTMEIENQIDGLSLRSLPLTQDDLIGQLVDKLRLLSNQDSI